LKNSLKIGIGIWLLIAIIAIPFPFAIFPKFSYTHSDRLLLYQVVGALLPIGWLLGLLSLRIKNKQRFILDFLYVSLSFILAFYLLKYGFDKVFKNQFYFPEPNTLHTPLGQLSKDILFWSSMGSSYWYNIFMGLIEVIPALFLLHRRTRMFGALISFGVLLNVWAINIGFDISVKVLSTLLVLIALYILSFSWRKVLAFATNKKMGSVEKRTSLLAEKPVLKRLLKGSIIGLFCIEIFLPFLRLGEFNRDNSIITAPHGSYAVIDAPAGAKVNSKIIRIHFHSKGWMILEDDQQTFEDYRMTYSTLRKSVSLVNEKITFSLKEKDKITLMSWTENGEEFTCELEKIDLDKLPLAKDEITLFVER